MKGKQSDIILHFQPDLCPIEKRLTSNLPWEPNEERCIEFIAKSRAIEELHYRNRQPALSEAELAATGEVLSDGSVYVANDVEDNEGNLEMIVSREEEIRQEKKLFVTFANLAAAAKKAVAEKRIDPDDGVACIR